MAILLSVKPEHCCNILNGYKILEIRKSIPKSIIFEDLIKDIGIKDDTRKDCKVYIYCTKGKPLYKSIESNEYLEYYSLEHWNETDIKINGKVVAEFTLNKYDIIERDLNDWLPKNRYETTKEQLKDKELQKFALQVAYRKQTGDWYQYWNGNGYCELNKKDGTMITTMLNDEEFKAEFPLNCDINISNNCCIGCEFCYQGCTPKGKHSDIKKFIEDKNSFLYSLHEGTELAINGNEPFHPDLELLLQFCKEHNIIANLTVNEISLLKHTEQLEEWLDKGLIHGIGISPKTYSQLMIDWVSKHSTAVIHTIAGITSDTQYKSMYDKNIKLLILGYKDFGRGVEYKQDESEAIYIKTKTSWLKDNVKDFTKHFNVVSFDNLAIEQLNPREWLSKKEWDTFFRGQDGSHTLMINLVDETFSKNSVQSKENCYPLLNNISQMLKFIQEKENEKQTN